jgi:hypothetical protein
VEDGSLGEKSHLVTYMKLVPGGHKQVLHQGNWVKCQKSNVWRKKVNNFLLPAKPQFLKCTQVLLSNVEKPHSGRAYKKIIVKKLCLYDDVPPVRKKRM